MYSFEHARRHTLSKWFAKVFLIVCISKGILTNATNKMSNWAQIIAFNIFSYSVDIALYRSNLTGYCTCTCTLEHFECFSPFFSTQTTQKEIGTFYISGFSFILQPTSVLQHAVAQVRTLVLYSHLQHFLKVPIQIPTRVISSLHSDVLPFILPLYYCQLSPVLGKKEKEDFLCFPLARALHCGCKSVSFWSLTESAQCHPCSSPGHKAHLGVIMPFPAVGSSEQVE